MRTRTPLPMEIIPRYDDPKPFIRTFRRWNLDAFMAGVPWRGKVLDVGGQRSDTRGSFSPPLDKVISWEYVNISSKASPDYYASADALPFMEPQYDMVLLAEVLEHLPDPEKALREAARVLLHGGTLVLTAPFLNPLHPDPDDFQRWLPSKYRRVLGEIGFEDISVYPMGGFFAVAYDLMYAASNFSMAKPGRVGKVFRKLLPVVHRLCFTLEKQYPQFSSFITTGYCVCAMKPACSLKNDRPHHE